MLESEHSRWECLIVGWSSPRGPRLFQFEDASASSMTCKRGRPAAPVHEGGAAELRHPTSSERRIELRRAIDWKYPILLILEQR